MSTFNDIEAHPRPRLNSLLRDQDTLLRVVVVRVDVFLSNELGRLPIDIISAAPSVIDESLRYDNVAGFRNRLNSGCDPDYV